MKGYIFTLEALVAIVIAIIAVSVLESRYPPHAALSLHDVAEDSLSLLKMSGRLQSQNPAQIEYVLNKTVPHHRLTIYQYNQLAQLIGNQTIGEAPTYESVVAKATWLDPTSYYLAVLEVWQ